MLSRKKLIALSIIAAALNLTGCGRSSMSLNPKRPNETSSNAARVTTSNTTNNTSSFGAAVPLMFYQGVTDASVLQNVTVARGTTNQKQLRVTAPSLGNGTPICVITGASCTSGTFYMDIGEERCGSLQGGVGTFEMARTDFNVVTIILHAHAQVFTNWWVANNATTNDYPSLAQGQISADLTTCQ